MSFYHIIGDADTVLGYRFAGLSGDVVTSQPEALAAFQKAIAGKEPGVLLITEAVEDWIPEAVQAHRLTAEPPYLAVIQDIWGARPHRKSLQDMIREAVGIKI